MADLVKEKCPLHELVQAEVDRLRFNQDGRKCDTHESRITTLEKSDLRQWDDIKELQRTVWKGVGILTVAGFFGSILGSAFIKFIMG